MQNKLFGQILSEGIRSVKARQNRDIGDIEEDIAQALGYASATIQSWRKGNVPKEESQVEFLAHYIIQNGKRGRQWLNRFLTQARYYDRQRLLDELCPEQSTLAAGAKTVYQNLPSRSGEFLGREAEMAQVIEGLASRWPLISIEGMGGIGKTTLATEVGCACLPSGPASLDDPFEACVFVSAKERPITLNDLLDAIARVLNYPYIIQQIPPAEKPAEVDRLLRGHRVLIIADNFETVTDPELVAYLQNIPEPSKALITTRQGQLRTVWPVPLRGLPDAEALELIRRHAQRLRLPAIAGAADEALKPLVVVTGGNPKAIEMAVGYLKHGGLALDSLVNALHRVGREVSDIFDYIFSRAWEIMSQDARHLLMAMPFFVESASKAALGAAAGVEGYYLDVAIGQLVEMSLLEVNDALEEAHRRYGVHPLTLAFAGAKLRESPEWERESRERWLQYFLEFAREYTGEDWDDWQKYEVARPELPNLLSVFHWAFDINPTKLALDLFDEVENLLFIRGMWEEDAQISRKAISIAREMNNNGALCKWLRNLAWTLIWRDEFTEAFTLLTEAIDLAEEIGDLKNLQWALHGMGVWYYRQTNYQDADSTLQRSLALALQLEEYRRILPTWYYLGCVAFAQRDFERAIGLLNQVKDRGHELNWARAHAYARNWLADIARIRGNYAEARQLLEEGFPVAQNFKDQRRIAEFKCSFALLEETEGNLEIALTHAREAHDLFTRLGMRQEIGEMEGVIRRLEEGQHTRQG